MARVEGGDITLPLDRKSSSTLTAAVLGGVRAGMEVVGAEWVEARCRTMSCRRVNRWGQRSHPNRWAV